MLPLWWNTIKEFRRVDIVNWVGDSRRQFPILLLMEQKSVDVKGNINVLGGGGRYIFYFLLFCCWDRSRFLPTVADSIDTFRRDETRQFIGVGDAA